MSEWTEYKLGDLCNIRRGASPRPIHDYLSELGMPWVKISDATSENSRYIKRTTQRIKLSGVPKSLKVIPGDFILSNSATPGIPKFLNIEACIHDGWLLLSDFKKINKLFLYYLLLHDRPKLANQGNGSVFTNLKTEIVKNHKIRIPDLTTQTAIAEILSSLDDKIELNNKINQELENLAQTLFKQWFIDFEFPNENGEPYKSSGGEMVDSELGEIPKGWEIDKIAKRYEVSDFVANGSFASLKENVNILEEPSYALFLRNTDSKSNFTNQLRYVDEKTYNFLSKSKIIGNEICISNVADVGTVFRPPSYLNKPMTLGNNLVLFRSNSPNYFYYYFKYFYGQYQIQSITSGSAQLKFNKTDFRNLAIIEVPKGILELFEHMISDFTKMQFGILGENVQLTECRDTLLPKLVSGELEINEINN